ncbi:hypothetical protein NE237_002643 [Protea cynaroides]|uniref:Uncharacterized protein n=1 Tax=Protea cynaroides TaxID=273540 RepID=A0A9Q0GPI6_9MAGN|nr:hypothetical protein NE237_002643 [Protea cynaroides]
MTVPLVFSHKQEEARNKHLNEAFKDHVNKCNLVRTRDFTGVKDIHTAWDHYANFSDVKWKIQPNDYKPTSLVIFHDWWPSSDSRLNSFQACYLPDGPLFKSVAVMRCANSPTALKDGGLSGLPQAITPPTVLFDVDGNFFFFGNNVDGK